MILDNLKELIREYPETDLIVLDRLIYVKLLYELYGKVKVEGVSIYSNEMVEVGEVELYGEVRTKLKRDLRKPENKNDA